MDGTPGHDGVNCDGCGASSFSGIRHKCLVCYNFDLCHACSLRGFTTDQHQAAHPMQSIICPADYELYFGGGGDPYSAEYQTYTCPYCPQMGFTESALKEHVEEHVASGEEDTFPPQVNCPICACRPSYSQSCYVSDFPGHLRGRHKETVRARPKTNRMAPASTTAGSTSRYGGAGGFSFGTGATQRNSGGSDMSPDGFLDILQYISQRGGGAGFDPTALDLMAGTGGTGGFGGAGGGRGGGSGAGIGAAGGAGGGDPSLMFGLGGPGASSLAAAQALGLMQYEDGMGYDMDEDDWDQSLDPSYSTGSDPYYRSYRDSYRQAGGFGTRDPSENSNLSQLTSLVAQLMNPPSASLEGLPNAAPGSRNGRQRVWCVGLTDGGGRRDSQDSRSSGDGGPPEESSGLSDTSLDPRSRSRSKHKRAEGSGRKTQGPAPDEGPAGVVLSEEEEEAGGGAGTEAERSWFVSQLLMSTLVARPPQKDDTKQENPTKE